MVLNGAHLVGDVTPIPVFPVGIILIHRQPQGDAWEGPTDVGVQRENQSQQPDNPLAVPTRMGNIYVADVRVRHTNTARGKSTASMTGEGFHGNTTS